MKGARKAILYCAAVAVLALGIVAIAASPAQAHFESSTEREITLSASAAHPLYLAPAEASGTWTEREFVLRGAAPGAPETERRDTSACLTLLAGLGIGAPENLAVTMTFDGTAYYGVPQEIPAGTELERSFGPGWQYRFYDQEGNEALWRFSAGQAAEYHVWITAQLQDALADANVLQLRLTEL
ncbi:MAG: hypothetical protein IJU18_07080 [Oscillospiraceae bacterium]|nr:hypothetical protein [Oscillospiraceae bacterium]